MTEIYDICKIHIRWCKARIQDIDIEGNINGIIADNLSDTFDDAFISNLFNILGIGDVEPDMRVVDLVFKGVKRIADADVLYSKNVQLQAKARRPKRRLTMLL